MATTEQVIGTWILILLYATVILYFVVKGALKIKNLSDYAVGNINFSPVSVGLSLAASMTSAATFVINPGFIANYGLAGFISFGIVFPLGSLLSLIILTKSFQKYGNSIKALTLAQWIGVRYKSKGYSLFVAFLSLLLITFIVLIVVAITKVLSKSLNVDEIYLLVGLTIFVFGYMMFGGANSMVYTNTVQAGIMILVAVILLTSGYEHFSNGINSFFDKLSAIDPSLVGITNPGSPLFRDLFEIVICQLIVGHCSCMSAAYYNKVTIAEKRKRCK
jgi:sodium/pantothenate symporter